MTKTLSGDSVQDLYVISEEDITIAELEPIIDQAIGMVNTELGTSISYLSGLSGAKTTSLSDAEFSLVTTKSLILAINALLLRDDTTWTIERRGNAQDAIGPDGYLTRAYEAAVKAQLAKTNYKSMLARG